MSTNPESGALPAAGDAERARHGVLVVSGSVAVLVTLAVVAASAGRYPLSLSQIADGLVHGFARDRAGATAQSVLWQIRLPRIALACLVGAGLSAAGAAFQHLFRNPLVAPDTLGVSSGAALGAVAAIYAGGGAALAGLAAFGGGLATVAIVIALAARITARDPLLTLVLLGVVIASVMGAAVSLLKFVADPYNQLPAITFWLMGSLAAATWGQVAAAGIAISFTLALFGALSWRIDLLALPEDEARALGVHAPLLRAVVVAAATVATAASVAVCGIIGWVGLVVPHMARMVTGPGFARLLPVAALFGAIFMLAIDTLARTLTAAELPPGILTAFIGTPLFIALLARRTP
jgi:iron complex transport system permease protein